MIVRDAADGFYIFTPVTYTLASMSCRTEFSSASRLQCRAPGRCKASAQLFTRNVLKCSAYHRSCNRVLEGNPCQVDMAEQPAPQQAAAAAAGATAEAAAAAGALAAIRPFQTSPLPGITPAVMSALLQPAGVAALAALLLTMPVGVAHAADAIDQHQQVSTAMSLYDISEGEEFWGNVAKYGRYFVTVMLGTGYVMVQPIVGAFKKPVTAVVALAVIVGGSVLLKFTLDAMLGITEPLPYESGAIVPYS